MPVGCQGAERVLDNRSERCSSLFQRLLLAESGHHQWVSLQAVLEPANMP